MRFKRKWYAIKLFLVKIFKPLPNGMGYIVVGEELHPGDLVVQGNDGKCYKARKNEEEK